MYYSGALDFKSSAICASCINIKTNTFQVDEKHMSMMIFLFTESNFKNGIHQNTKTRN